MYGNGTGLSQRRRYGCDCARMGCFCLSGYRLLPFLCGQWRGCCRLRYGCRRFCRIFLDNASCGQLSLLAYNTDAHGVAFTGLESRNAAEVRLVSEMQPGNVYSWNVDDVDVPLQGTVQYTPVPRPLVKQMLLHFQVTGMEEAKVLNGKLNGVYPSVLLLSGEPSEQSISAAPETNTSFTVTLTRAETRNTEPAYMASAEIRLLGLLSPEYGAAYDSRLHLQVRNSGGEMYSASVNMNGTLTDIIRLYAGELPADETVEVELGINLLNAVLTAEVKGWTEGSGEGGVGDYKRKVFYDKRERIMYE